MEAKKATKEGVEEKRTKVNEEEKAKEALDFYRQIRQHFGL